MQGSNSLEESDSQPLYLCPECHAKILLASGCQPKERFKQLIEFCDQHGLEDQKDYFEKALARL